MEQQNIKQAIREILVREGSLATRDVVAATGISPQAAHYHLKDMLASGEIIRHGRGRATRYRLAETADWQYRAARSGLDEETVWRAARPAVESLTGLAGAGVEVFEYALTELVNNAIEHSDAREVTVELRLRVVVKLYQSGRRFISRAAARRVVAGLERFEEVVLDFSGVEAVGQGFVDEVFRVWAASHPETALIPRHMSPEVAFMVERGLPDGAGGA